MNKRVKQKWIGAARAIPEPLEKLPVPVHVLTGEAVDLVRFSQRFWEPTVSDVGEEILPGLKQAVGNGTFLESTPTEMLELVDVVQEAQTEYRLLVKRRDPVPVEEAQSVLGDIRATLEWAFDDGQITGEDAQLSTLAEAHDNAYSYNAIAASLFDYAELAERHLDRLEGLGGFRRETIEEARTLARRLRDPGAAQVDASPADGAALDLRNRLATLLYERMLRTRAAARFIFRRCPHVAREAGSTYERRRRAASRRRQAAEAVPAESEVSPA